METNVICKICGKTFEDNRYLSAHLKFDEHIDAKTYYDTYYKQPDEEKCHNPDCKGSGVTTFIDIRRGYTHYCSRDCSNMCKGTKISKTQKEFSSERKAEIRNKRQSTCLNKFGFTTNLLTPENMAKSHSVEARRKAEETRIKNSTVKNKTYKIRKNYKVNLSKKTTKPTKICKIKMNRSQVIKKSWETRNKQIEEFCIENNCTPICTLLVKYGQGFLSLNLPRIFINKQNNAISNEYIPIIEEYARENHYSSKSKAEMYIEDNLEYDGEIIPRCRKIISPYELDLYLPNLKLAIEFNGMYWHSIEFDPENKYTHRRKSLLCRDKGIRLIHIFEFEDLDDQIFKINQLIQGNDLFENNFTKNSLIDTVPDDVYIIYQDGRHTLYSA